MEIKDLNTVNLVLDFEKDILSFVRKHSQMIKNNLETVRRIESLYFSQISDLGNRYGQEEATENKSFEINNEKIISSCDAAVRKAKSEFDASSQAVSQKYDQRIAEVNDEAKHREAYYNRLVDTYNDYMMFFTMGENYGKTKLRSSGHRWFVYYKNIFEFIKYANNNYSSVFDNDNVDLEFVFSELKKQIGTVIMYEEQPNMIKKMKMKNLLNSSLGNIAVILQNLYTYLNNTKESYCDPYKAKCPGIISALSGDRDNEIESLRQKYDLDRASAVEEKEKLLAALKSRHTTNLDTIRKKQAEEKMRIDSQFEKDKERNEEQFRNSEDSLNKEILLCLDTKFSVKVLDQYESIKSHIDSYSDMEVYKPTEENNPYVRLGSVFFDFSNHDEIKDDMFVLEILKNYYKGTNCENLFVIPYVIDFRNFSNIQLACENNDVNNVVPTVRSIVTRLFCNMMAGRIKFTFIDLVAQGQTFAPFMQFISASPTSRNIVNQGTCTDSARTDEVLDGLENSVRDINANIYTRDFSSVIEYNEVSEPNVLPINIIVIMNYPEQLSEEAVGHIEKIVRHSKRCGYHFLFVGSGKVESISQFSVADILNDIEPQSPDMIDLRKLDPSFCRLKYSNGNSFTIEGSSVIVAFEEMIKEEKLTKISANMKDSLEKSSSIKVLYSKINNGINNNSAIEDIRLPFALVGSSDIKSLIFGDKYAGYAAVVGVPRSGKSNALHVLIMSALSNYSPDELQIYLLDYKLGVEAYKYSEYRLPHFKVISTTKNAIFGINVIASIDDIMEERTSLFTANGCVNYTEYRKICNDNPELNLPKLPRILVIIDEMHALINAKGDKENNFSERMARLIKTSPSYGIHMILASQTVTDWNFGESFDLITSAIAFKCAPESEKKLLGQNSDLAQQIPTSEPGRAIYSADRQNPSNNQFVRVGFLDANNENHLLKQIADLYKNVECETRINAAALINRMDNPIYKLVNGTETKFTPDTFTIGENLDLDESSDVVINGNLMMIGDDRELARNYTETLLISILCNNICNKTGNSVFFLDLTEFTSAAKLNKDLIYKLSNNIGEPYFKYFNCVQVNEAASSIYQTAATATVTNKVYIFIFGLTDSQQELLTTLLSRMNPNIHVIIWCNTYESFSSCLAFDYHKLMAHRLVFCSPENDVKQLTSRSRDLTDSNYALYRDINSPLTAKEYAPYKNTNDRWIEELIAVLKSKIANY